MDGQEYAQATWKKSVVDAINTHPEVPLITKLVLLEQFKLEFLLRFIDGHIKAKENQT